MILDEIKKSNIEALKNKDSNARTILGVVSNKAMLETIKKREKGENLCDADMVQILQKTIKELNEEAENYLKVGNTSEHENVIKQKQLLEKFLPQMMSENEIRQIIAALEDKSVPSVMKHFKANYAGKCDMKLVSEIARQN